MSRCAFALVALLLAGTLPLAARAGEPAPPKPAPPPSPQAADTDPGPEVIIYVPIDEMDVILEADRRGVVLRYEEYRALLEEARARARAQARRPPARAALLSATGEVDLETGRLVATWRVRVLEDGVAFVPFPFHDVALETIEVEGGRYEERNAMGWLRLEGKGERSVRVVGRVGETEDGERHSVAFRLPPAAAMALRVAAPASATGEVAGEGAPIAIETGPSEGEIVDVRPAPDGRVAASWTPAARGPVGPPVLDAEIQVLHVLAGNLARTRAVVRVRISRTPAQSVALSLPAASAVRSVGGKGMIGSRRSDDRGTLTLDFDAPHRGVVQAVLDLETPYEPGPDTALPRIDVVDAVRQRTELALRVERGVVLEDVRIRGGRRLPLPKKAPDVLRYELADASSEVRVDLVPTELVIEASSTWYLNLTEAAKTLLAAVTYRVDEGNAFVLEPHFPEGFRLTDLQIDGQRDGFRHEMREDGVLEVHLARAVPKNATVQLAATLEQAGVDWVPEHGRIAVPFRVPSAGADREEGFVAVGADASFRVLDRDVTDLAPVGAAELTAHGVSPEGLVYGYRRDGDAPHLVLEVERRVPRVDADVIARAIPLPGRLEIVAQVIHRIERSGLRRLAIDIPAWAGDTVRIEGAGVTSSHAVDDAAGVPAGFRRWEVTLSRRLLGAHRLRVRYHEVEDAETWTIPADRPLAPRVPDVRETRSVVVERAAGLEVDLQGDLPIQDLAELPAGAQVNPLAVREVVRLPGDREGPGIAVTKHEGTEVLDAIGTRVEVETAVASAGILRTQARIHLENVGLQFLRVALPRGSTLVGAIVDEQPVKPLVDEAGVLRVPIPPAHRDGARTVARLTYDTHLGEPLGDAVAVPAPRFPGLEVLETTIEVAVDPGLEIEGVKGDFGVARRAPEPPLPWIVHALGALVAEGKDAAGAGPTAGAVGAPSAYTQRPHGEKAPQKGLVPLAEPTLRAKPRGAEETTGSMVEDDEGMPVPDAYARPRRRRRRRRPRRRRRSLRARGCLRIRAHLPLPPAAARSPASRDPAMARRPGFLPRDSARRGSCRWTCPCCSRRTACAVRSSAAAACSTWPSRIRAPRAFAAARGRSCCWPSASGSPGAAPGASGPRSSPSSERRRPPGSRSGPGPRSPGRRSWTRRPPCSPSASSRGRPDTRSSGGRRRRPSCSRRSLSRARPSRGPTRSPPRAPASRRGRWSSPTTPRTRRCPGRTIASFFRSIRG